MNISAEKLPQRSNNFSWSRRRLLHSCRSHPCPPSPSRPPPKKEETDFARAEKKWTSVLGNSLSGVEQRCKGHFCWELSQQNRAELKCNVFLGKEQVCHNLQGDHPPPEHNYRYSLTSGSQDIFFFRAVIFQYTSTSLLQVQSDLQHSGYLSFKKYNTFSDQ